MLKILIASFILIGFTTNNVHGYKILMVCPPPSRSHHILCRAVSDVLGERGHEVTFISSYPLENSKHREIGLPELEEARQQNDLGFTMTNMSKLESLKMLANWMPELSSKIFSNKEIVNLLTDKSEKFDLVILEYFLNDFLFGFSVRFDCPLMTLSPVSLMSWLATMTGNPLSIATVPNVFTPFSAKMSLMERIQNTVTAIIQEFSGMVFFDPIQELLYHQYFPNEANRVPYYQLKKRIAGNLINTHPSAGVARPLLPNSVEIGGYHIVEKPLSGDLKKVLDSAKNGVIFFSMGSNLKSSNMTAEMKNIIIKTFESVKETVLWKFETDLPEKPSNVIIDSWLPQTSILAHPNVKLFISHGGLLSCTEAVYFGVPMLIMPVFGDQHHNAKAVSERGHGMTLDFENVTENSLKWAINEAVTNTKYRESAKRISELFHDRPIKPRDLLGYHVEHIIRTNGAPHLSPPPLSRFSNLLLDVAACVLIPVEIITLLFLFCLYRVCCRKKKIDNSPQATKKKNR